MKKLLTIIAMVLMACTASWAQTAQQILDRTAAKLNSKGGAKATFKMSGKYGSGSGTIAVKGSKFNAYTPVSIVWYDGKTQWTYMKKTQEVNISNPTEAQQQAVNPYKFIYIYKNGYALDKKSTGSGWQVHLTAKNQKRSIKEMYVTVDKSYTLKQVRMRQANGWTTFSVGSFKTVNLSDSQFRFNSREYPNAEVIDLR